MLFANDSIQNNKYRMVVPLGAIPTVTDRKMLSLKNVRVISQSVKIVSTQHLTIGNYRETYYGEKYGTARCE